MDDVDEGSPPEEPEKMKKKSKVSNTPAGFRAQFRRHMDDLIKLSKKPIQPYGYYARTYPEEINAMLEDLEDYVPVGEVFLTRLNLTKRCFITDKNISLKEK